MSLRVFSGVWTTGRIGFIVRLNSFLNIFIILKKLVTPPEFESGFPE